MHTLAYVIFSLFLVSSALAQEAVPGEIIVHILSGVPAERLPDIDDICGTRIDRLLANTPRGTYLLVYTVHGRSVENAIRCWEGFPGVHFAHPNRIMKLID